MSSENIRNLISRYPQLDSCKEAIEASVELLKKTFINKNRVFICGNGGSWCDSQHIAGELLKGFLKKRRVDKSFKDRAVQFFHDEGRYLADNLQGGFPVVALGSHMGFSSAYINDVKAELVYAQELFAQAVQGDVLICISTSANSGNAYFAAMIAKLLGVPVILMCGSNTGRINPLSDIVISVPEQETYKIQELHLPVYHAICAELEDCFYE